MAGSLTIATRNKLLTSLGLKFIQLHTADPTDTGLVGAITGTAVDFSAKLNTADQGAITTKSNESVEITVTVSGSPVVVSHYTLWDGTPGTGNLLATGALSATQTYNATGKYIVNTLTVDLNK